jgi:hypothetical protein
VLADGDKRYAAITDVATTQGDGFQCFIRLWFRDDSPGAVWLANIGFLAFCSKVSHAIQQICTIRGQGDHIPRQIECAMYGGRSESVDQVD